MTDRLSKARTYELTVTQERVRELLNYDPETGVFTWKKRHVPTIPAGARAGSYITDGYVLICFDRMRFRAHRLAWFWVYGKFPDYCVDHINGVRDDNRIANLRDVPRMVNQQNQRRPHADSLTGVLGVKRTRLGTFEARMNVNCKYVHLGTYRTAEEAHAAYVAAKRRRHEGCTLSGPLHSNPRDPGVQS